MVFKQSLDDFPLTVRLGENAPSFGLSRWGGKRLRFVPPDDEGFALRGDERCLVYKGRRRSHRFTVLGDGAFEYDCILNREPDSDVVALRMEGAGGFDFFKQPDFVPDPFLKGSYAVYKKETLPGEGTGKLCQIHRPLVIDARGRRVWGDLSVCGDMLYIAIPEGWLSGAAYPVVVDPVIGTQAVGSQTHFYDVWNEGYMRLGFGMGVPVNRFWVPEAVSGLCYAQIYTDIDDFQAGGRPVLYSDSGGEPHERLSSNEGFAGLRVNGGNPAGWRVSSFYCDDKIEEGSYVWFGVLTDYYWNPRFDYGASCYLDFWYAYDGVPDIYPLTKGRAVYDFKLSMYFDYVAAGQHFVRTLTQGVSVGDNRGFSAFYRRFFSHFVSGADLPAGFVSFFRRCVTVCAAFDCVTRFSAFSRLLVCVVSGCAGLSRGVSFVRKCAGFVSSVCGGVSRRFFTSRDGLVLKSCVTKELFLDSKII